MSLKIQFQAMKINESLYHMASLFVKVGDTRIALVKDRAHELDISAEEFVEPAIRVIETKLMTPQRFAVDTREAFI